MNQAIARPNDGGRAATANPGFHGNRIYAAGDIGRQVKDSCPADQRIERTQSILLCAPA